MKNICVLFISILLMSCENKYAVTISEYSNITNSYIDTKPKIIKAPNDSLAYVKAYEHYCYIVIVEEIMFKGISRGPRYIKLLDKNYNEIKNKGYLTQSQKDSIYSEIRRMNEDLMKKE